MLENAAARHGSGRISVAGLGSAGQGRNVIRHACWVGQGVGSEDPLIIIVKVLSTELCVLCRVARH
jgi:hypothetical protein